MRMLKCFGKECEQELKKYPKSELFAYKNKNYCFKHFQQKQKEDEDRAKLYGMIKKYFNISYPTGLMLAQIKKFQTVNGYSLESMADTIDYMASLPWVVLDSSKGLGLIPYVYDDAYNERIRSKSAQIKAEEYQQSVKKQVVEINEDKFFNDNVKTNKKKFNFGD